MGCRKILKFAEITVCYVEKTLTQINLKTIDINGNFFINTRQANYDPPITLDQE